ncbi:MAG TPA: FAD-dependent oxidoreductase [Desulfosalsimonadaceae bacterium]|nr:FAD-dependent oxidoreductase [Desulfosalsimonadaceae bacterium]
MKQTDVLVIGGSAAGIVAATTAKSFHPDKSVMLIRKDRDVLVPCGIPYIFGTLESSEKNVVPDAVLANAGVELKIDEVLAIDQSLKTCRTADNTEIAFDKLIMATGSTPIKPGWLAGADLENVFTIPKNKDYLDDVKSGLNGHQQVAVVGGGFIGVELADELAKTGKTVTLIEMMPYILSAAFDQEFAVRAQKTLEDRGIPVKAGSGIKKINGREKVTGLTLTNGEILDTDAVILSVGYQPNTALAEKTGLSINEMGFIKVNEYMRTENPDIFAVGDCAEKYSFVTRTLKGTMLASTACAEARISGMNLYKLSTVRSFGGTISIYCTAIGDMAFGAAGVTENLANERGFEIITGTFEGVDRHPGTLPDTQPQAVKLIAARDSGIVLGGEVIGGKSTGELTNLIGFIIQSRMSVDAVLTAQIGTHPLLTAPPTAYPLIKAAEAIARQRKTFA